MGSLAAPRLIGWRAALRLGRVSNLPTVWSNVLAGSDTRWRRASPRSLLAIAAAMSLLYVGGMYLNDAFDREIDARERASRPIPSGEAPQQARCSRSASACSRQASSCSPPCACRRALTGLALAALIVVYDPHHKGNPLSPLLMGLCRALVYVGAAAVLGAALDGPVLIGAVRAASVRRRAHPDRQAGTRRTAYRPSDHSSCSRPRLPLRCPSLSSLAWRGAVLRGPARRCRLRAYGCCGGGQQGDVGRAVGLLIAAIALVDALAIAGAGAVSPR